MLLPPALQTRCGCLPARRQLCGAFAPLPAVDWMDQMSQTEDVKKALPPTAALEKVEHGVCALIV